MLPKGQLYPTTKIKIGAVLYSAFAWTDEAGKTCSEVDEWIVRSIQAKRGSKTRMGFAVPSYARDEALYVNITRKVEHVTWGKLSKKTGDFGWLKSIPADYRKHFKVGEPIPPGIYTTSRAAVSWEIASTQKIIDWYIADIKTETDAELLEQLKKELAESNSQLAALIRRFAKLKAKKK